MSVALRLAAAWWSLGNALHAVELHDSEWTLSNGNGSITVAVANASSTHVNLMQAGVLRGDPYFRDNELMWSWVPMETWKYRTSFLSTPELLRHSSHILRCQVDTVARVTLNGQLVGSTFNMFVQYDFDVSGLLRPAGIANTLEVHILPVLEYAANESKRYPYTVPESVYYHTWDEGSHPDLHGHGNGTSTHRNFVRKAANDFGWDWGPAFVPGGITRLAVLARTAASLEGVAVRQWHNGSVVVLTLEAHVSAVATCRGKLTATLEDQTVMKELLLIPGTNTAAVELRVAEPKLWWPAGMGGQTLYTLTVVLQAGPDKSQLQRRIGFRTVELVQEPRAGGASFFFRVNGVDVFARGSNLIPLDVFAPRAVADVEWVLQSAVEANMNMVRVWGGGIYQPDKFYDLADELGLMLWQEMMFACALYPRHHAFLESVAVEVEQQVLRLQHHASIVVWGGNNENEGALKWYDISRHHRDRYVSDYNALYVDTVRPALRRIDPDIPFVDSSPSNGVISEDPYVKRWSDVPDLLYGDVHYYNYDADCEDASTYPGARFVSEYGFQSFPSFLAYKPVLLPEDWSRNSTQLFQRQRHEQGQEEMLAMISRHFRVPPEYATGFEEQRRVFDDYLYLTQVQQSRCYETAFEQWRRLRSDPTAGTMGILYWQLNDIWPGPSWASLEHSGAWRLTHSAVQRSFAPVLASLRSSTQTLQAFVTSDLTQPLSAHVQVYIRNLVTGSSRHMSTCDLSLLAETKACPAMPLDFANCSRTACFAYLHGNSSDGRRLVAHTFFAPLKDVELPVVQLTVRGHRKTGHRLASFVLEANATALYVTVESELAGRFVPNGLLLLPGEPVVVEFRGRSDFELGTWASGLRLRSLRDTYLEAGVATVQEPDDIVAI